MPAMASSPSAPATSPAPAMAAPPHPLAPLSRDEFVAARDAVVGSHASRDALFFRSVYLEEPPKADLVPFLEAEHAGCLAADSPRPARRAAVEYDVVSAAGHAYTRAVDVGSGAVVSSRVADAHCYPYLVFDEFRRCEDLILNSPVFKQAMAAFALPDGFGVVVEPWPYGAAADEHPRRMQGLVYAKDLAAANDDANHYAFPIPIMPVVDCVSGDVIRIDRLATGGAGDGLGPQPPAAGPPVRLFPRPVPAEYVPELLGRPLRADLRPLDVVQPEGASFAVAPDGLVEWQRWRFRVGFTPREGAVLHDVCYDGRPVAYRLSYSELTVPYADPRPPYQRKQAFDFGDGGVGRLANSLELGCDCLGAVHYLDALLAGPDGAPAAAPAVVCLHEQDAGLLWKHTNYRTGRAVVVRARELVVQFVATLANYEYVLAFKLDLAGALTLKTRATGIVSVVAIDDGKRSDYGNVVAPGVLAQNHQHIFAVRVDPAIDSYRPGATRVVVEESLPADPDPATNPHGNLYHVRRSAVPRAAWIDAEPRRNRLLRLESTVRKNPVSGNHVAYKVVAPATQTMLAAEDSLQARRAPFARHNAWVTGFRDGEFFAAGEFTNQSTAEKGGVGHMVRRGDWFADAGRPEAARARDEAADQAADEADPDTPRESSPVVWIVYGLTHNPRVEDWPVMPAEAYQLHLRPADFFTSNPALDVPSSRNEASVLVPCCGAKAEARGAQQQETGGKWPEGRDADKTSEQQNPLTHLQGTAKCVDAQPAGASALDKEDKEPRKTISGPFRGRAKGGN